MLSVSLIAIVPLQLGLECVVLLGEVLLSVVVGVAPPVAPLKGVWGYWRGNPDHNREQ